MGVIGDILDGFTEIILDPAESLIRRTPIIGSLWEVGETASDLSEFVLDGIRWIFREPELAALGSVTILSVIATAQAAFAEAGRHLAREQIKLLEGNDNG